MTEKLYLIVIKIPAALTNFIKLLGVGSRSWRIHSIKVFLLSMILNFSSFLFVAPEGGPLLRFDVILRVFN